MPGWVPATQFVIQLSANTYYRGEANNGSGISIPATHEGQLTLGFMRVDQSWLLYLGNVEAERAVCVCTFYYFVFNIDTFVGTEKLHRQSGERDISSYHMLVGLTPGVRSCIIQVSHADGRGPGTWTILQCFPWCINKKLDGKWNNWTLNLLLIGCQHSRQQFSLMTTQCWSQ